MIALLLALGATPSSPAQWDQLIATAIEKGRLTQAREMLTLEQSRRSSVTPRRLQELDAELTLKESRFGEAFQKYSALLGASPADCAALQGAGTAALQLGRIHAAQSYFEKAAGNCPDDWKPWNLLGVTHDRLAEFQAGEAAYRNALKYAPANPAVLNNLGYSLLLQKRFGESEAILSQALSLAPTSERTRANLDIALTALGRAREVVESAQTSPNAAARLNNAGYAAMLLGMPELSRELLSKAAGHDGRAAANLELLEKGAGKQ